MNTPPSPDQPREFASLSRDQWIFGDGVIVLMYHKVAKPAAGTNLPALYVHPGRFVLQMDELISAGAECVPFSDLSRAPVFKDSSFCLTFDDGFRNVFDNALPVMRERKWRSIQFIVGSMIGKTDQWDHAIGEPPQPLMDEAQIREWLAEGQDIGSHTLTHPRLTQLSVERARTEIFDSKKLLEDRFGREIRHFCYPYGDYNSAIRDLVGEAGYRSACTVEFDAVRQGAHPHALPRVMATDLPPVWRTAAKKLWHRIRPGRR
jgi:peptidoglycan/xylan/chitin deacetylase (PgdA/CDA1 family)